MTFKYRGWLLFCATTLLIVAFALIAYGFLPEALQQSSNADNYCTWQRITHWSLGAVSLLLSLCIFFLQKNAKNEKSAFVEQKSESGEIRISMKAIESLVQKCIDYHEDIRVVSMKISNAREGVSIELSISLANNISIPLAVASLQKQIKQYLLISSGIDASHIMVYVETADDVVISQSPYLLEQDFQKEHKALAETEIHERIFEKEEEVSSVPEQPTVQNQSETEPTSANQEEAPIPQTTSSVESGTDDDCEQTAQELEEVKEPKAENETTQESRSDDQGETETTAQADDEEDALN